MACTGLDIQSSHQRLCKNCNKLCRINSYLRLELKVQCTIPELLTRTDDISHGYTAGYSIAVVLCFASMFYFMVYHPVSLYTKSVTHSIGHIVRVASYMGMELYRTYRITLRWAQFN